MNLDMIGNESSERFGVRWSGRPPPPCLLIKLEVEESAFTFWNEFDMQL